MKKLYNEKMRYSYYSENFRKSTIEYREEGHTLEETNKTFKVSIKTIRTWEKKLKEEGTLARKPLNLPLKKINPDKLIEYIKEHPDVYLKEIAEEFGCCINAISKALKRLEITRKKSMRYQEQSPEKVKEYEEKIKDI